MSTKKAVLSKIIEVSMDGSRFHVDDKHEEA